MDEFDTIGMENTEELEDGTILDIDTSDAVEPTAVEDGEYKVRITGFRKDTEGRIIRTSEKGYKYFILSFDIPDEPFSKGLSKIYSVPTDSMDAKQLNAAKWDLEVLKRAFGLDDLNFDSMVGREGYALLTKTYSSEYGEQNRVKKFVVGA